MPMILFLVNFVNPILLVCRLWHWISLMHAWTGYWSQRTDTVAFLHIFFEHLKLLGSREFLRTIKYLRDIISRYSISAFLRSDTIRINWVAYRMSHVHLLATLILLKLDNTELTVAIVWLLHQRLTDYVPEPPAVFKIRLRHIDERVSLSVVFGRRLLLLRGVPRRLHWFYGTLVYAFVWFGDHIFAVCLLGCEVTQLRVWSIKLVVVKCKKLQLGHRAIGVAICLAIRNIFLTAHLECLTEICIFIG